MLPTGFNEVKCWRATGRGAHVLFLSLVLFHTTTSYCFQNSGHSIAGAPEPCERARLGYVAAMANERRLLCGAP